MIVALPLSSTSTSVPSGNLSLLASSILSFTVFFSSSVSLSVSSTSVFSGIVGSTLSASFSAGVSGLESLSFGSVPAPFSSSSVTPSPSSSVSVTSGSPSPSVSLSTVIVNVTSSALFPASSSAFNVTVKPLVSSSLPQSSTVGVPVIFPVSLSYVTPFGRPVTATSAFSSSVSNMMILILYANHRRNY